MLGRLHALTGELRRRLSTVPPTALQPIPPQSFSLTFGGMNIVMLSSASTSLSSISGPPGEGFFLKGEADGQKKEMFIFNIFLPIFVSPMAHSGYK